jgi:hypothetical protein
MSTISVTTPDHLWRAFNASGIPVRDRRESRLFVGGLTNAGARLTTGGQRARQATFACCSSAVNRRVSGHCLVFFLPNT